MRRFPLFGFLLLLPALSLVMLTGCPADKNKTDGAKTGDAGKTGSDGSKTKVAEKITAPTDGTVIGVVKFDGEATKAVSIINKDHKDFQACMAGGGNHLIDQKWLVDAKGCVANVLVTLLPVEGKEYDVKAELKDKWKKNAAILDQPFCAYTPHIVGIYAGVQPLTIKNSAKIGHNVIIAGGIKNGDTNDNMEPGKVIERGVFKFVATPVNVSCSVHGWMTSKIVTVDHPYFAVTKEDGSFEIGDVPSGVELRVFVWHESFDKAKEAGKVTAKAKEKTSIDNLKVK